MTIQATTEQINNTNLNSILLEKTYQKKFNIIRANPQKNYRMVPRWLTKAMRFGTSKARAVDYQNLNYMLDWHPNETISPEALESHAAKDGHNISRRAAYQTFENLEKAGHIKKKKQQKNSKGKFLKQSYQLWEEPFGWKTECDDMHTEGETVKSKDDNDLDKEFEDLSECDDMHTAYNKERAGLDNKSLQDEQQEAAIAAAVEIRKLIDPKINFKLDSDTIKSLKNIEPERIKIASREAMQSKAKRKAGLFLKIARSTSLESKLKSAEIPTDATPQQIKFIKCYNSNCEKEVPTCSTIQPNDKGVRNQPTELCKKYCPFVIAYKELFK